MLQFLLGRSLGVDEFFWKHQWTSAPFVTGRMSPRAAASRVAIGLLIVLCATGRTRHWLVPVLRKR